MRTEELDDLHSAEDLLDELRALVGVNHRFATKEEHLLHGVRLTGPAKERSVDGRRGLNEGRYAQRDEQERDSSEAGRSQVEE